MPFKHTDKGWMWGNRGPFPTKAKAIAVATAAHASGFKEESEMDKNLIGGFVLQVDDQQIDASVSAKLKKLKRELLESQS